jgi:hypothetical protein
VQAVSGPPSRLARAPSAADFSWLTRGRHAYVCVG